MTTPTGRGPRRAPGNERLHALIAGSIAVLAVVLGILAINLLHNPSTKSTTSPPPSPPATSPAVLATPPPVGPTTAPPSPSRSPTTAPTTRTTAPARTTPPPLSPSATVHLVFAPVVVYNNSKIEGLAATAATKVRAAGFDVKTISGVSGRWSETTVYYDPPDAAAAQSLIALVPGVRRALPRPSFLAKTGTLILVVTKDFPVSASS